MRVVLAFIVMLIGAPAFAWDGYDYDTGNYVEIGKGNLVREGQEIEIYDYETGNYHNVTVEDIDASGDLEVYDQETGEYRSFDMD